MDQQGRAMIRAGVLGRLYLLHGHYLQDWLLYPTDYNWRVAVEQGGASRAFGDIGTHWCDLVEHVTGQRLVRLSALSRTFIHARGVVATQRFSSRPVPQSPAKTSAA